MLRRSHIYLAMEKMACW